MAELVQGQTPQKSLEERLQPWIDQGEYIILLVMGLMAWSAGWVDLVGFRSPQNPSILGRYSLPFFAVLAVFTLGFIPWLWLIRSLKALDRLKRAVAFIQQRSWLYILIWLGFIGIIASMFVIDYWRSLPLLQVATLVLMVLFTVLVLLYRPTPGAPFQRWRKVALALIGALILFEVMLQLLAQFGVLPINNMSGITTPYGRVYQISEGRASGTTNQFGWYYPDFRLRAGTKRIILSGDTFVQAVQIPMSAHMGRALEKLLNTPGGNTEVIAQGQPGYGSTMFINPLMSRYIWEPLNPNEIVVLFHVANDFQLNDPALDARPKYQIGADGKPAVVDSDFAYWHTYAHRVIAGHDPVSPIRTLLSQSMAVQSILSLIDQIRGQGTSGLNWPLMTERATEAQPFGPASPLFDPADSPLKAEAFRLFEAQLRTFNAYLAEQGIVLRVVTIPHFPASFYAAGQDAAWDSAVGSYDLLGPERYVQGVAANLNIPFLGMGQYMRGAGLTPVEIQAMYFNGGKGHLTEAGHRTFADAMFTCFFAESSTLTAEQGCARAR